MVIFYFSRFANKADGFDPRADEDCKSAFSKFRFPNLVGLILTHSSADTITGTLYWSMVEVGVGLLAVCLPTIRFLFRGLSPESVINSIRSAFSLHSLRSQHSRMYDGTVPVGETQDGESTTSRAATISLEAVHQASDKGFPITRLGESDPC